MNRIPQEWLDFLREQYPVGSRIQLKEMGNDLNPILPGSMGTLKAIDDLGTFHVKWDNGRELGVVIGEDRFTVHPPEPTLLKFYMPLTADFYPRDEWGDTSEEGEEWDGRTLLDYENQILGALVKERMPEEKERGLMHWYGKQDSVDSKVRSAVFTVEEKNGQLWGVAECQVVGRLAPAELDQLKDYITGQASDGWGEGFEQREIRVDGGELYVHLWNFDDSWSIQTEQERFTPKVAEGLPELCFSTLRTTGQLICIKRGESGYDLWYEMREEVLRTYKNDLPERLPLSRQKEFKPIKNMVIQEAVRLGELRQIFHPEDQAENVLPEQEGADGLQPEPEADGKEKPPDSGAPRTSWEQIYRRARAILKDPNAAPEQTAQAVELLMKAAEHGNCSAAFTLGQLYLSGTTLLRDPAAAVRWLERAALGGNQYAQYRLGKLLLQGEDVSKDADDAVRWLKASAEQGNQYAQYALGKLLLLGEDVPEDREAARQWFQQAAEQGNQYAQYFVEHMGRRDLFPVAQSVAQLLHHLAGIFREQSQPPRPRGLRLTVDKKLWRKIREKKIAMGHKPDDHEEPTITM